MRLQERLDTIRSASHARIPEAVRLVMDRSVQEVRASGLAAKAIKVGDRLPDFTLPETTGQKVASSDLLARGPLVVSFYRGRW